MSDRDLDPATRLNQALRELGQQIETIYVPMFQRMNIIFARTVERIRERTDD